MCLRATSLVVCSSALLIATAASAHGKPKGDPEQMRAAARSLLSTMPWAGLVGASGALSERARSGNASLVVIVSIDGLRPDAIGEQTPTLRSLASAGAHAAHARTIGRSTTLPAHASMLTGVGTRRHGIRHNAFRPDRAPIRFPTILRTASAAGLPTSMFVGKQKLVQLVAASDVDVLAHRGVFCRRVNERALPHLAQVGGGLHFVHYAEVDGAGHVDGWMSDRYMQNARRADACLGGLVETLSRRADAAQTLLIVTADHGGHGRTHGTTADADVRIPWIAWGGVAAQRTVVSRIVDTRDTAATALEALGLARPANTEGTPVVSALRAYAHR